MQKSTVSAILLLILVFASLEVFATGGCESTVVIILENNRGGYHAGQKVTLTSRVDGKQYIQTSDARGEASVIVPCNEMFDLFIANYTKKAEVESPANGRQKHTFSYAPDMLQKQKLLAMSAAEKKLLDEAFKNYPDTIFMKTAVMSMPAKNADYYALVIISISDITGRPLAGETLWITGRTRKKTMTATTDKNGRVLTYLPKGETYDIHFKYHRSYFSIECDYSKGTSDVKVSFSYLGTREIERRRKEEADRIIAEEKKLREARERFEKDCKASGLTIDECYRMERDKYLKGVIGMTDTIVSSVLNRNKWDDKLIICDVTGSMDPYVAQVALWYRLRSLRDGYLQFVFFNDGDNMPDERKRIGETGGIHYTSSASVDSLDRFMSHVQALGSGGDCAENNMEAMIRGIKLAKPFKELVMIADNNAPVKDIALLSSFHVPVHVVVCGASGAAVHPDYMKIAWKTKGTIHTLEEDITTLARLSEGQQISVAGVVYKIMGGEFVELTKD
jgi:hypothetical protein